MALVITNRWRMGEDSTGGGAAVLVVLHAHRRYSVVSLVGDQADPDSYSYPD
jgi:hypothetical protein